MATFLKPLGLPASITMPCEDAMLILKYAHLSSSSLLKSFERSRKERGNPRGTTTDEEQDLLRAMLVMAGAGLDAMAKQLIADSLPVLVIHDVKVRGGLEKFIERRISSSTEGIDMASGARFLARALSDRSPQSQLVEDYIVELTGGSLQAVEGLHRVCQALGLSSAEAHIDKTKMAQVFKVRNRIIHEFDMDVTGNRRKRIQRRQADMISHVEALFHIAEEILKEINTKLEQTEAPEAPALTRKANRSILRRG